MATAAAGDKQLRQKRRAEDELEDEQPLAKRFGFLNIDQFSEPVSTGTLPSLSDSDERPASVTRPADSDGMQIDDTKTRVYINDLESEIAEIEKDEEKNKIKFIPEIERELMAVPSWLLLPRSSSDSDDHNIDNNQVILYQDPAFLSIPKELDNRKSAAANAKRRGSEKHSKQPNGNKADSVPSNGEPPHPGPGGQQVAVPDPSTGHNADAMDLD